MMQSHRRHIKMPFQCREVTLAHGVIVLLLAVASVSAEDQPSTTRRLYYSTFKAARNNCSGEETADGNDGCTSALKSGVAAARQHWSGLREESWVVPLIALASINIAAVSFYEIFVLAKTLYARPSRRHLFLGQILLLGLFLLSLLGFAFVSHPSWVTCTLIRLGIGLAYTIVFATLLVKCVFLISLNGGVYLPATYLALLVFFAVAVQVAVTVEWLLLVPPMIVFSRDKGAATLEVDGVATISMTRPPVCNTGFADLLLSLVYVMFLLCFVSILAVKSCGIRENYREAAYIGVAMVGATVIWCSWMIVGLFKGPSYQDPCLAYGSVVTASIVFIVMFIPKGRQLSAVGQEGLCVEDRVVDDDMVTNGTPSVFAPSFYHFTPAFVPVWDSSNAMYKNAIPDRKCHKISNGHLSYGPRPTYKASTQNAIVSRTLNHPPVVHNSMLY